MGLSTPVSVTNKVCETEPRVHSSEAYIPSLIFLTLSLLRNVLLPRVLTVLFVHILEEESKLGNCLLKLCFVIFSIDVV